MGLAITVCGLYYAPEHTGTAPYISGIAEGLAARGHDVRVITGFPHYPAWNTGPVPWTARERRAEVEVVRHRHYVPRQPSSARRIAYETTFGLRATMASWDRPDVVLLSSPALLSSAVCSLRARLGRRRPPLGVIVHDLYAKGVSENVASGPRLAGAMAGLESTVLRSADACTVVHERFRAILDEELGVRPERVSVIPNWTHIEPVRDVDRGAVRRGLGWGEETVVLHAGNMGVKQGLEHVVAAARRADERAAPVRFVLLGDGNQRARLERDAAGVERLQILDPLPDRAFVEALAAADLLLVHEKPGHSESAVPSKLTSYFAAGNAVLGAVDPDGLTASELGSSGGGIVVRSGDADALVDSAVTLGDDGPRRRALAEAGLRYVTEHLSAERAIDRYEDWVHELARSKAALRT